MNIFATDINPVVPVRATDQLRAEMIDLIGKRCPYEYDKDECKAYVLFKVNINGEIEVLNVISANKKAEPYLKQKLNNKIVERPPYEVDQIFNLPLRIIRE